MRSICFDDDTSSTNVGNAYTKIDNDLKDQFQTALKTAQRSIDAPYTNFQGYKWETVRSKDNIKIETSKSLAPNVNLFRSTMTVMCSCTFQEFVDEFVDYNRRPKWDNQLKMGRVVLDKHISIRSINESSASTGNKKWKKVESNANHNMIDANVKMVRYATTSAMGGIVKPRLFTDAVVTTKLPETPEFDQAILSTSMAWDLENMIDLCDDEEKDDITLNYKEKDIILGGNSTNNSRGIKISLLKKDKSMDWSSDQIFNVTMVSYHDVGGKWLSKNAKQHAKNLCSVFKCYVDSVGGTIIPDSSLLQ